MRKVKLSFIENKQKRKTTLKKRKNGVMKKLDELVKLCDIKACGVFFSPSESIPEVWPSREGVDEVVSMFKGLSMNDQTKKMVNQESFLRQMLNKEKKKLDKLYMENREFEIQNLMFRCLKGEVMDSQFNETDVKDLRVYMIGYLNKLTHRIETLTKMAESSSSLPPPFAADAPIRLNVEINRHDNLNLKVTRNIDLNLPPNPSPKKKTSFMDLLMGHSQEMSDNEDW